ncbi:hypothetical protein D5282_26740 [bacterium 1xD8-48]|nr:hypothetical protein [Lachnospiraceae bacterium]NBK00718.1 hypothetical protein [bacterium 1xD8-48]RKI82230.1 hypothetical protein D7V90_11405 [bacterium 1xD42-87]
MEVCSLSGRANPEPLSSALHKGLRFFQHPLPSAHCTFLAIGLPIRERIRFTLFRHLNNHDMFRFCL